MRIALTGTHSTGKTSILEELRKEIFFNNYIFINEITRSLLKKGLTINENGNDATQVEIIRCHLNNLQYINSVMDRCFLDGIVYTHYLYNHGKLQEETFNNALTLFEKHIECYDFLFYFEPEFPIKDDGIRSTSISFQEEIASLFQNYIKKYSLIIYPVCGTIADRKNLILKTIGA